MNKKLSIVIVTYNSEQLIYDCLNSIYKYNDLDDALEVIVVDNDSSNQKGLIENLSKSYHENLILIKNYQEWILDIEQHSLIQLRSEKSSGRQPSDRLSHQEQQGAEYSTLAELLARRFLKP